MCDRIERALAAADESSEVIEIRDEAERMAALARIRGFNRVSIRLTNAVRKAEIKWARITPKQQGARTDLTSYIDVGSEPTERQAGQFRAAAAIDDGRFDELMARTEEIDEPLTRKATIREAQRMDSEQMMQGVIDNPPPPPTGQYATIVIDPPWPIDFTRFDRARRRIDGTLAELGYPTMSIAEIAALPLPELYGDDTLIYLWTIQKYLPTAMEIIRGWQAGYRYTMVWVKDGGYQVMGQPQGNCEFVVVAAHGKPKPMDTKALNMAFYAPRAGHSVKPEEFYVMLWRVAPGPRLDMFSRREIEGFDGWGNE